MNANATSLPVPSATVPYDVEVYLDGAECAARIAGHVAGVLVDYTAPDYSVGCGGGFDAGLDGAPAKLVDRAEWDAVFPGVEPTADAVKALFDKHEAEIAERAIEVVQRDREADFDEPDCDGSDWGGDY